MMIWLIVVGWIICGVLAYGVAKNNLRQHHSKLEYTRYDIVGEFVVRLVSVMGPIGLISIILETWIEGSELGLYYRMPKELCPATPDLAKRDKPGGQ